MNDIMQTRSQLGFAMSQAASTSIATNELPCSVPLSHDISFVYFNTQKQHGQTILVPVLLAELRALSLGNLFHSVHLE
jgi:hypothetical protein